MDDNESINRKGKSTRQSISECKFCTCYEGTQKQSIKVKMLWPF